jgi:coproporphyrinogen III oxidase
MQSSVNLVRDGSINRAQKGQNPRRNRVETVLKRMFDDVCQAIEEMDGKPVIEHVWNRSKGGVWGKGPGDGMTYTDRVLHGGNVFEKVGANYAAMEVQLPPGMAFNGADVAPVQGASDAPNSFYAVSTSFVIHPRNPMAPTAHVNYRYFELDDLSQPDSWWFGGGGDLTPSYLFKDDAIHFHETHKAVCDKYDPTFYPRFKEWCDEYFYLPHREECRGVGGIFFDYLKEPNWDTLFSFVKNCSEAFLPAYLPIVERRKDMSFTEENKFWQRTTRGRYAEFIMAVDRGTRFGMQTGLVRPQSVLNPMPETAHWQYDDEPSVGTPEARLKEVLRTPFDWLNLHTQT